MSRAAVRGVRLTGFTPARAAVRGVQLIGSLTGRAAVRGVQLIGSPTRPRAAVRGVRLVGATGPARAAVRGVMLIGGGPLTANAGGGQAVEPFTVVTLDGRASVGATSWTWTQVSGPAVTIVGSGAVVGFEAPATEHGADIVIRLTASDGTTTATDDASISVYPCLFWRRNAANNAWVPRRIFAGPFPPSPSRTPMPVGNLPGWTQVVAQDFVTDVPEGGFVANANGDLTSAGAAGYAAYGAGGGSAQLTMYPKSWANGTAGTTTSRTGIWDEGIVSVQNSMLQIKMRTLTDSKGTWPRGAAVKPILPSGYKLGPYGKYSIRCKTTDLVGDPTNFHTLLLAIDSNPRNWDFGELDWMECDARGTLNGWYHYATPVGTRINQTGASTGVDPKIRATSPALMTDWNIVDVEWTPSRMKWTVWSEGSPSAYTALSSTTGVPTNPLAVLLQCEPAVGTTPAPENTATLLVDWITMYEYAP